LLIACGTRWSFLIGLAPTRLIRNVGGSVKVRITRHLRVLTKKSPATNGNGILFFDGVTKIIILCPTAVMVHAAASVEGCFLRHRSKDHCPLCETECEFFQTLKGPCVRCRLQRGVGKVAGHNHRLVSTHVDVSSFERIAFTGDYLCYNYNL
jgi:hypothetical protein